MPTPAHCDTKPTTLKRRSVSKTSRVPFGKSGRSGSETEVAAYSITSSASASSDSGTSTPSAFAVLRLRLSTLAGSSDRICRPKQFVAPDFGRAAAVAAVYLEGPLCGRVPR